MKDVLNEINDIPGVRGSIVLDMEGLVIASNIMSGLEERTISAMVANIYHEIARALAGGEGGGLSAVQLLAGEGNVLFMCGTECILTVIADPGANIGLVSIKMKASLDRLLELL
ncbi:MAG: roadblock/LC7 domain-containing protein [Candidatus Edwardsbacteria bacterium]|nr:roadblock/LC7 domain-containing protein [Candidatus Edwardsbacteria bacterium]